MEIIERMLEFYLEPFKKLGIVIKNNKALKRNLGFVFLFFAITTFGIIIYASIISLNNADQSNFIFNNILPFFLIPFVLIILLLYFATINLTPTKAEEEINKLSEERKEIKHKIEQKNQLEIFDTIQLSLNQLNEYYTINKVQAKSSFNSSIISIIIGFFTIISGIFIYYIKQDTTVNIPIIAGLSGLILEFIGGAYFFMYKKSLQQVNFFFAQLIKVQDTMLSINLANKIESEEKKTEMTEKIIISLLERSLK